MRWLEIGLACVLLSGCSKAPDGVAGETVERASNVAFAYRFDFRLPSSRIADAQEAHAQACEALGERCRITGMDYRLDAAGRVSARLDMRVAAPIARVFGRRGVQAIERAGGTLTGAQITGTDAAPDIDAAAQTGRQARDDLADVDRQLARPDLPSAARAAAQARRAETIDRLRESGALQAAARTSIATTPIGFTYEAGSGVGLGARLSEAAETGYASLTWTLATALTLLAYLGPPLLLILLLALLWQRAGRALWHRVFPPRID